MGRAVPRLRRERAALFFLSSLTSRALVLVHVHGSSVQRLVFERVFAPWAAPPNASLAYAVAYVLVWWSAMWLLVRLDVRVGV